VSFFFVLSGFVLCHSYGGRLASWQQVRHFMLTRTFRLYPLHLAMLAFALAVECAKVWGEHHGMSFGSHSFAGPRAVSEILPNLLLLQSWWPGFDPLSFNYPAWSISIEYYLYVLFAVIALLAPRRTQGVFAVITVMALVALAMHSPLLTEQALQGLGCFFGGAVTYRVYRAVQTITLTPWLGSALEVSVLGTIVWMLAREASPPIVVMSLLFCLAVLVFAFEAGTLSTWLGKRFFAWLGTLSYSIYLTHATLLFLAIAVLKVLGKMAGVSLLSDLPEIDSGSIKRFIDTGSALLNNALVAGQLVGVLVVSTLTYRYVELPGIAFGKKRFNRQPLAVLPATP
jgi:peptidoglycan/LPS O-acetylase OafA/YrhL